MRPRTKGIGLRERGTGGEQHNSDANPTRLTPALQSALARVLHGFQGNGVARQRNRLLAGLHLAPLTTLQLREHLDILHPAMRVKELRDDGHEIDTVRVLQDTTFCKHSVAKYVLKLKGVAP